MACSCPRAGWFEMSSQHWMMSAAGTPSRTTHARKDDTTDVERVLPPLRADGRLPRSSRPSDASPGAPRYGVSARLRRDWFTHAGYLQSTQAISGVRASTTRFQPLGDARVRWRQVAPPRGERPSANCLACLRAGPATRQLGSPGLAGRRVPDGAGLEDSASRLPGGELLALGGVPLGLRFLRSL